MNLKSFGYEAIDYDIQNEFNETDVVIDLFKEIEKEYNKYLSGKSGRIVAKKME